MPSKSLQNYHVILTDDTERNIRANKLEVRNGNLIFTDASDNITVTYPRGAWVLAEVERKDDTGQ